MQDLQELSDLFRVEYPIKKGKTSNLFKAYDLLLNKAVVVKEVNRSSFESQDLFEQYCQKARRLAKVNHQNMVHILDILPTDGSKLYIVTEFIDGIDLHTLLRRRVENGQPVPQHLAMHIVAQISKALDYAMHCHNPDNHKPLNFVHGNITPANIMISRDGITKLIDFGLETAGLKGHRGNADDYRYASPEHISLEKPLDNRSDLFSLGLILYELLEGKQYFSKNEPAEILRMLGNGRLRLQGLQNTPKHLQRVLSKSLEKLPTQRYQNPNQLYIDLVTHLFANFDLPVVEEELAQLVGQCSNTDAPDQESSQKSKPGVQFLNKNSDEETSEQSALSDEGPRFDLQQFIISDRLFDSRDPEQKPPAAPAKSVPLKTSRDRKGETPVEDEVKTVIDIVRLSARRSKKILLKSAMTLASVAILLFALDFFFHWTQLGQNSYDYFFPPAIQIASVPAGAQVYLNDEPLAQVTPIPIDKIRPGVHELKLTMAGYAPITRSIFIPSKGQGSDSNIEQQAYTFRFSTTLRIQSQPSNATIFVNGLEYGEKTPTTISLEVGEPCEIRLTRTGFPSLGGFRLETVEGIETIDDRRLWDFTTVHEPTLQYQLEGHFGRYITINSNPLGAKIYLNSRENPIGITGQKSRFFFPVSSQKITLKKEGYNTKTFTIDLKRSSSSRFSANLSRSVKFMAYAAAGDGSEDLRAVLTKLVRNGRVVLRDKVTPQEINLQPFDYSATFSKRGYLDTTVDIGPADQVVIAQMKARKGSYSVVIVDQASRQPIDNVTLRIRPLESKNEIGEVVRTTNTDGTCEGILAPGMYFLSATKEGYARREKSVMIQGTQMNLFELNLAKTMTNR